MPDGGPIGNAPTGMKIRTDQQKELPVRIARQFSGDGRTQ
jgi:hypothetical protein